MRPLLPYERGRNEKLGQLRGGVVPINLAGDQELGERRPGRNSKDACQKWRWFKYDFKLFVFFCDTKQLHCSNSFSKVYYMYTRLMWVILRGSQRKSPDLNWQEKNREEGERIAMKWGASDLSASEDRGTQSWERIWGCQSPGMCRNIFSQSLVFSQNGMLINSHIWWNIWKQII